MITLDKESKTKISLSNESKNADMTWDSSDPLTWDDADSSWDAPKIEFNKESKTKITLSKETK